MDDLIETPYELRKQLGNHFELIKRLDPWQRERDLTDKFKRKLIRKYKRKCAYCNKKGRIEAAHIIPLEVGGTTVEKNLVLLCKKCHQHYDSGFMSIYAMGELAIEWRKGLSVEFSRPPMEKITLPSPAMTPPPKSVQTILETALVLQSRTWYCKAIDILENALKDTHLDSDGRQYLLIKCAELARRRSARGVVPEALSTLQIVNHEKLPVQYQPVFYYELAYVYRLRGNHSEATRIIRLSAEASKKIDRSELPPLTYISASAIEILCLLAAKDELTKKEAKNFIDSLHKLELAAAKHGEYWGGRWALNCAAHRLQVYLKIRDEEKSWETLQRLRDLYYRSDLNCGWDAASKQTISLLEGLTRVLFPREYDDLQVGIGLLARAFVTRLGPRQRPEGIRDVGFSLIKGIRKTENKLPNRTVDTIERVMSQTMDGTSVLWPWRADD